MPDSISTDLHTGSMNAGMKDMLNVMSKFLIMGMTLEDVVLRSTWNPAREIRREDLGHLSVGAPADLAVLRLEKGAFGFVDVFKARMDGTERLACEMTVRGGKVVYELNGITRQPWNKLGSLHPRATSAGTARMRIRSPSRNAGRSDERLGWAVPGHSGMTGSRM